MCGGNAYTLDPNDSFTLGFVGELSPTVPPRLPPDIPAQGNNMRISSAPICHVLTDVLHCNSGTAIYLFGTTSTPGGQINIHLDGNTTSFDRFATEPLQCDVELFFKDGLQNTSHTLTATLAGDSPGLNGTSYLQLQRLV